MFQIFLEFFSAFSPYAKIIEYGVIFATVALGIFAAGRLRASTRELRTSLDNAVERLKAQSQEMASELEAQGLAAIERIRAKLVEDKGEDQLTDIGARHEGKGREEAERLVSDDPDRRPQRKTHDAWWQPVVDMKFTDADQPSPRLHWKNNVRVPMPWRGTWLTGWRNDSPDGVCGVALSGTGKSIDALWRRIRRQAGELESELPNGATVEPGRFGIGILRRNSEFRSDDDMRAWIIDNLDRFARALRPRMEALVEKRN